MKGNPVMRAKRTHGPTPHAELSLRVALTTCDKCDKPPIRTIPTADNVRRACADHIGTTPRGEGRAAILARVAPLAWAQREHGVAS